jgi:hypothetical protein
MFPVQEIPCKPCIRRSDLTKPAYGICPTEELCLEILPAGPKFQQSVHQKLHEVDAIAFRLMDRPPADHRQKKTIWRRHAHHWVIMHAATHELQR